MAKKKKKTQLSSEGKTELAKAIAEKSQTFARTYANVEIKAKWGQMIENDQRMAG